MHAIFGKMSCLTKYGLFIVNLIFTLGGLALVGVSVASSLQASLILNILPREFGAIPRIVIILGLLIFFIAFFGCWIGGHKNYLILYAVSMLLLALSKIYLAVVIFQNLKITDKLMAGWLGGAFEDHSLGDKFHEIEATFRCCGTTGPESYILTILPSSCCPPADSIESNQICNATYAYEGCNKIITSYSTTHGQVAGIIIVLIIIVEISAMVLSIYLFNKLNNKKQNV